MSVQGKRFTTTVAERRRLIISGMNRKAKDISASQKGQTTSYDKQNFRYLQQKSLRKCLSRQVPYCTEHCGFPSERTHLSKWRLWGGNQIHPKQNLPYLNLRKGVWDLKPKLMEAYASARLAWRLCDSYCNGRRRLFTTA